MHQDLKNSTQNYIKDFEKELAVKFEEDTENKFPDLKHEDYNVGFFLHKLWKICVAQYYIKMFFLYLGSYKENKIIPKLEYSDFSSIKNSGELMDNTKNHFEEIEKLLRTIQDDVSKELNEEQKKDLRGQIMKYS